MSQPTHVMTDKAAVIAAVAAQQPLIQLDTRALPEVAALVSVPESRGGAAEAQLRRLMLASGVGVIAAYRLLWFWGADTVAVILSRYRIVAADLDVLTLIRR
ncbi:hypothetical protein [Lacticaseibacillus daqingensis]|uniref:hypothetical protein n=1 Tax=Lacticaseibacillus daqingensis TaxID=2486014 RepID=UPI000F796243|nr:hypothetical protein [Lacticaseibacillus daqingensis]